MKQMIAFSIALFFTMYSMAAAESVLDGSDPAQQRNHTSIPADETLEAELGATVAARRAAVLPIARSVKPGGLPLSMIDAIIIQESGYRSDARGARGEVGLMQILPSTARSVARNHGMPAIADMSHGELVSYLSEPRNNLRVGLAYLYWCYNRAEQDVGATIGCYNAGPGNMWRWESISITRNYVHHVRQHMARSGFVGS